jgi:hypothetical protein
MLGVGGRFGDMGGRPVDVGRCGKKRPCPSVVLTISKDDCLSWGGNEVEFSCPFIGSPFYVLRNGNVGLGIPIPVPG